MIYGNSSFEASASCNNIKKKLVEVFNEYGKDGSATQTEFTLDVAKNTSNNDDAMKDLIFRKEVSDIREVNPNI